MRHPDLWQPAIDMKLEVIKKKEVWRFVPKTEVLEGKKIIDCMWVLVNKTPQKMSQV